MTSKRAAIVIAVVAVVIGILADRYLIRPASAPVASISATGAHDDAAASASRAMTFTQPKAPAQ